MRHILLLCCLTLCALPPPRTEAAREPRPRRRALLVGAWDYGRTPPGDFWALKREGLTPGPVEDVNALKQVLISRLEFREDEIKVLTSRDETTRASIVKSFRSFLIEQTGRGDIVHFHYSGHGSQLPDDDLLAANGRLVNPNLVADEPDDLDETLVPTDYGEHGANQIRDDEINALVGALMAKSPGSVLLTFDSCYSGTVARRSGIARGRGWQQPPEWAGQRRSPARRPGGPDGLLDPGAARDYVAISAAREGERAWQIYDPQKRIEMGRFTSALATALYETDPQATYEDLFNRIRAMMAHRYQDQHPQMEGAARKVISNGLVRPPQQYVPAYVSKQGELILEAGVLHGMTQGSVVALHLPEAKNLARDPPAFTAEVAAVRMADSTLRLIAGETRAKLPVFMKAVEVQHRYGGERLSLLVDGVAQVRGGEDVLREARALPAVVVSIQPTDPWDVRLRPATPAEGRAEGFVLERADGTLLDRVAESPEAAATLAAALRREAKWRYVKELESRNPHSSLKVRMRVIEVEARADAEGDYEYVRDKGRAVNPAALRGGDFIVVDVMLLGDSDAYLTLFDLFSSGGVCQLWPEPGAQIVDNFIPAEQKGKWVRLWSEEKKKPALFQIGPPYGADLFKLFATGRHINFRTLLTLRGPAAPTPLESLLRVALGAADAGAVNVAEDWYTDALTFETTP